MSKPFRITIVGSGVSGLAAAYRLKELSQERGIDIQIQVLEASPEVGPAIMTTHREGFLLESGPDSFITEKPWAMDLCKRLGIETEVISTQNQFRKSYVVRNKALLPVPEGFYLMAPVKISSFLSSKIFSLMGKTRMVLEYLIPKKKSDKEESLTQFIHRRFGKEALERIVQPMISGVYAADPDQLSLRATFPKFLEMEKKYGSVIRGLRKKRREESSEKASGARYSLFASFKGGMRTLVDALVKALGSMMIRTECCVEKIEKKTGSTSWQVYLKGGEVLDTDYVVLALPANRCSEILKSVDLSLVDELSEFSFGSVATVNLAYAREDIKHSLDGFGFVVPAAENIPLVGCTFSNVKYEGRAPKGFALLRAFVGGVQKPDCLNMSDEALESLAHEELSKLLGIKKKPHLSQIGRYDKVMPHYYLGHLERVERIEKRVSRHEGLSLVGNSYRGVGIPDAIHSGEQAAEEIIKKLAISIQ